MNEHMRTRLWSHVAVVLGGTLVLVTLLLGFGTPDPAAAQMARAEFIDGQGKTIGTATLRDDPRGVVLITVRLANLPPGRLGFHIHAIGRCDPPDFASAGPHFNPELRKHGLQSDEGPHAGDLRNLIVEADGTVEMTVGAREVTLGSPTNSHSLFGPTGTALVVHARADDMQTDPAGGAGPRIACGVIMR